MTNTTPEGLAERLIGLAALERRYAGNVQGPSFRGTEWGADIIAAHEAKADTFEQAAAALRTAEGELEAARKTWRCFHCEFETANRDEAEQHFGPECFYDPMCKMTDAGQRREYINLDRNYTRVCKEKQEANARAKAAEEQRDRMRGALEPFLRTGDAMSPTPKPSPRSERGRGRAMISLRSLERIRRELERASRAFNIAYPSEIQPWDGDAPDLETIRNLQTARAQIDGWIMFRRAHGRDQFVRSPIQTQDGGAS